MTDERSDVADPFAIDPSDRPDYFAALGFDPVDGGDGIDCPDCGATMQFSKKLQTEPMDSDAKFTAYRCADCMALDWVAESDDVDPADEERGIAAAIQMRGRDK